MRLSKIIQRRIRSRTNAVDFVGDVNAAIAANVGERGPSVAHASSSQQIKQETKSTPPRRKED